MHRLSVLFAFVALVVVGVFAAQAEPNAVSASPPAPASAAEATYRDALDDLYWTAHNSVPPTGWSWDDYYEYLVTLFLVADDPGWPTAGINSPYSASIQLNGRAFAGWTDSPDWDRVYISEICVRVQCWNCWTNELSYTLDTGVSYTSVSSGTWNYGTLYWSGSMSGNYYAVYTSYAADFWVLANGYRYTYSYDDVYNYITDAGEGPSRDWRPFTDRTTNHYSSDAPSPHDSVGGTWIGFFI